MELQLIQEKIYEIRGQKIMFDFDLAELYEVETRVLNQAVKRNLDIFPKDFMFQLTKQEWTKMSSQIVMTYSKKRPKTSLPLAFTEHIELSCWLMCSETKKPSRLQLPL